MTKIVFKGNFYIKSVPLNKIKGYVYESQNKYTLKLNGNLFKEEHILSDNKDYPIIGENKINKIYEVGTIYHFHSEIKKNENNHWVSEQVIEFKRCKIKNKKIEVAKNIKFKLNCSYLKMYLLNSNSITLPIIFNFDKYKTKAFDFVVIKNMSDCFDCEIITNSEVDIDIAKDMVIVITNLFSIIFGERTPYPEMIELINDNRKIKTLNLDCEEHEKHTGLPYKIKNLYDLTRKVYLTCENLEIINNVLEVYNSALNNNKPIASFLGYMSCFELLGRKLFDTEESKKARKELKTNIINSIKNEDIKTIANDKLSFLNNASLKSLLEIIINNYIKDNGFPIDDFTEFLIGTRNKFTHIEDKKYVFEKESLYDVNFILRHIIRAILLDKFLECDVFNNEMFSIIKELVGPYQYVSRYIKDNKKQKVKSN
jgi:hypothetical protein